jgi:anti-sigma factor RsiW
MAAMDSESFEFELSQYLDGDLSADRRAEIERRLQSDPAARAMLEDFAKIDVAARASGPMPEIEWDELASRISRAVRKEARPPALLFSWPIRAGFALAAMALLVFGLMEFQAPLAPLAPAAELLVIGPQADAAVGPSVVDVSVGKPLAAQTAADYVASDSVLVRPSVVALDGVGTQGTDKFDN